MKKRRQQQSFFASLFSGWASHQGKNVKDVRKIAPPPPFQAISVAHGTRCCAAARELEGYRFLAKHSPPLPLKDCTLRASCECRYMKHADRRGSPRRLVEFGLSPILFSGAEQRKSRGRRMKDR